MNITAKLSAYALSLLLAVACTDEDGRANQTLPENGDGQRREVLLTLKNKLAIPQAGTKAGATKADAPIATAGENYIRSLDVYVFASDTEDGDYTFQELFYFRDNAAVLPGDWAHEINLTPTAGTDNTTTSLLKLSKGLFVKMYCVTNRAQLYRTEANGAITPYLDFQPLRQSAPGQDNNVVTPGIPTEEDFLKLHTQRINPAAAAPTEDDILATPLPMAGAYTTPLDLTDFSVSARTQVGFKLTRAVSRFDIQNDAAFSKFTITGISMAQARPGATFFPIRVLGTLPEALDGELITTPTSPFSGDKANKGLQTGAFYSYASPTADEAYLILKGTYAVNETESQEVSYRIPFKPANDAEGASIEINHNHRYTIAINDADIYHLDFTLTVADWADDGSIDDYAPGGDITGTTATVDVTTDPNGKTTYDQATRTINMPIATTTKFDMSAATGYTLTKKYTGGLSAQQYDWLEVSAPVVVTKATTQQYTFSIKSGYTETEYPEAVVKIKNENNGDTQLFRVVPTPVAPLISSGATYTLAAAANTVIPSIDIEVSSIGGSMISGPDWLTYDKVSSDATATTYRVSLNPNKQGITFPEELPAGQTLTLTNKRNNLLSANVTVNFTDAVRAEADLFGHDVRETDDNSYRVTTSGRTISLVIYSMFKSTGTIATTYDSSYGTGNNWLPTPTNPTKTELVDNRRKYTYQITIPASTGLDKEYQLHRGTISVKNGSTTVKNYTIWRGASNKPYPAGDGSSSPFYTALYKNGYWWAPVNCGARHVAQSGYDINGLGNLYQWGRIDATNHGGGTTAGPVSYYTYPSASYFYTGNSSTNYDWLSPKNNNLWQNHLNDPCPTGYRVPTISQLRIFGNYGYWSGGMWRVTSETNSLQIILPPGGLRQHDTGGSRNAGSSGYYWSSSTSGNQAEALDVSSSPWSSYAVERGYGFSVRCVRE